MHLLDGPAAIDDSESIRLGPREFQKGSVYGCVILGCSPADRIAFLSVAIDETRGDIANGRVDDDCDIRHQSAAAYLVQSPHTIIAHPTRSALIGATGIEEAVADHPVAGLDRGANFAGNVIGPRGSEKQRLRFESSALPGWRKEQLSDRFRTGCSARLARQFNRTAFSAQEFGQQASLSRLAHAFATLECDETARHHVSQLLKALNTL